MSEHNSPDGLPDWEERMTPAEIERAAVVFYMRRTATNYRRLAARALADTQQNKPDADLWTAAAKHIDELAGAIEKGGHLR